VRAHRLIVMHQSIEELLHEPGCPFCRFLKDFQAIHLQGDSAKEIHRLCNFHAWGVAAVQDAQAAAEVFLTLVNENGSIADRRPDCDVCRKVIEEEDRRIRELVTLLGKPDIVRWLRSEAVFCIPHALKLRQKVPLTLTARIDMIIENYREQLKDELLQLRNDPSPDRPGYGALGRAAEFLVSQRGLRA
jgi:hypothetical protein